MHIHKFAYSPKEQSISYMQVDRPTGYRVGAFHMHDHEEIVLVDSKCSCRVTNNGNSVEVQTPAILLHRAGTFHEAEAVLTGEYSSQVVFFHPQMLQELPKEMRCEKLFAQDMLILPLTDAQLALFTPLLDLLRERPLEQKRLLLLCILSQMEQLVREGTEPITAKAHRSYIFDAIELIQTTAERYTAAELAERFHVSQSKLKADFKGITGLSVTVFCRWVRLQKAQVLLETTGLDQAQIAERCGFGDESYFIESFRKAYGMTPGTYRRSR